MLGTILSGGGREWPGRSKDITQTRAVSDKSRQKESPEHKAAMSFFDSLNTLTFNPEVFAVYLGRAELVIQKRVLSCLIAFVDLIADRLENGVDKSEEEIDFIFRARRVRDAMSFFRENGML